MWHWRARGHADTPTVWVQTPAIKAAGVFRVVTGHCWGWGGAQLSGAGPAVEGRTPSLLLPAKQGQKVGRGSARVPWALPPFTLVHHWTQQQSRVDKLLFVLFAQGFWVHFVPGTDTGITSLLTETGSALGTSTSPGAVPAPRLWGRHCCGAGGCTVGLVKAPLPSLQALLTPVLGLLRAQEAAASLRGPAALLSSRGPPALALVSRQPAAGWP